MRYLLALATLITTFAIAAPTALSAGPQHIGMGDFNTGTPASNGHPSVTNQYTSTVTGSAASAGTQHRGMGDFITTLGPGGGSAQPVAIVSSHTGFSWADAGIGAAASTGVFLALLGGALLAVRRNPRLETS